MLSYISWILQLGEERKEKLDLIKIVSAHTQVRCLPWCYEPSAAKACTEKPMYCERLLAAQVVAGTNYKLLLDVANSANKMEHIEATVYGA